MANELRAYLTSGKSVYAVLLNAAGQARNGSAFETLAGANWTNYDIALTEAVAGVYLGNMPSVAAGSYSYVVYEQAGATAAVTDALCGLGSIDWDGSAEIGNSALATAIGAVATVLPSAAPGAAGGLLIVGSNHGRILFDGQISIFADEDGEGAVHIINTCANGVGVRVIAAETDGIAIKLTGDAGNDIVGNLVGSVNGLTLPAQADVRTAVGLAAADLDTQLSSAAGGLTAIKGAGWTDETLVALDVLLDAIKAKTDLLTAGNITMVSPVTVSGDVTIDQGYDYYTADGRGLSWTDKTPATWPDLSGATATLRVGGLAITGTITNPTGPATITVELSSLQTASLAVGVHRFKIDVTLANTHLVLQVRGNLVVS